MESEFGSNELDGLLPYGLRRKMVRDATDLRSLIRVKIADDADLLQHSLGKSPMSQAVLSLDEMALLFVV